MYRRNRRQLRETAIQTLPVPDPTDTGAEVTGDTSATKSSQPVSDDAGEQTGAEATGDPLATRSSQFVSPIPGSARPQRTRKTPSRYADYIQY